MSIYITRQMIASASDNRGGDEGSDFVRRLFGPAIRKWRRRKMIAALEALDDRSLRDIGIYRGDIPRVVDGFDDRELGMVPFASAATPLAAEQETYLKAA
ncbi:MAG: DUF1127 domain-containing protein [Sedimentitalea sp.]|nr:DUF1127 domain-containing protein [Sedimentitalea sp.]